MNELWQKRTYPMKFELWTGSKFDHVELYGTFENGDWSKPYGQLTYSHQKNLGEFIYSEVIYLLPRNYEYKYKINDKNWYVNTTEKIHEDNNIIIKDDFIQMIIDRYDILENKKQDDETRYHDVAFILYKDHTMYDIELIVNDNQHFKGHRAILAAGSGYFKNVFQTEYRESNNNILSLQVDEIEAFPWMFKFLYTGTIGTSTLNFDQIESLMKLASIYHIPTLLKTLINLVTDQIDANNCLRLLFMEHYLGNQWTTIRQKSIRTAAKNFLYICHQMEFLKLPFDVLSDILDHSEILIANQPIFYSALMRWSRNQSKSDDEDIISSYMIADLYQDSFIKCNEIYKIPSSIVCFLADGTEKYTNMTINAINSFLKFTPHVMVGILLMDLDTKIFILSKINRIYHYRIIWKQTSKIEIIKNWNPTQYKMDIIKFAHDGFQEIFWMDSDTMVYKDMTSILYNFRSSKQQFYLIPDSVMFNKNFMKNWREEHPETLIPQACFMGFKSSIMSAFFLLWKQSWMKWIEPQPFSNYKDPNPKFVGSAFCIEQYALGNAIYHYITKYSSTIVLNENLILKYINKIERNLAIIGHRQAEEEIPVNNSKNLCDLVNNGYLSYTTSDMPMVYYYSFIPISYYSSQLSCYQTSTMGSFAEVTGFTNNVNYSIVIDKFFDCLFHFYNQNYDVAYDWYLKNFS